MRILLSPAKTFRNGDIPVDAGASQPLFADNASELMSSLSLESEDILQTMMDISPDLALETARRHMQWGGPFHPGNARTAIHAFHGEVFRSLGAERWNASDLDYAQDRLRIISGLYGLLRPLDLIQEYRLEMGGKWSPDGHQNLYEYWGSTLANSLHEEDHHDDIVNLASQEYFKAVDQPALKDRFIHVQFKEERQGAYKMIGTYAKTARGRMAKYLLQEKIDSREGIQGFTEDGYTFNPALSGSDTLIFTRNNTPLS
jgi:cytoplasmic iron level regulating protein YaaA (DUF328/UPF0246 family)